MKNVPRLDLKAGIDDIKVYPVSDECVVMLATDCIMKSQIMLYLDLKTIVRLRDYLNELLESKQ